MTAPTFLTRICGFLLLAMAALSQASWAGNLTASVDRDTLGLQETFTLTLRYDDQISAQPDYSQLQKDFDILNTQSGSQVSIVNGEASSMTQWKIALAPKRIGTLLIPSFNINGAVSDAIPITVTRASQGPQNTSDQVSVEIETNKDSLKVQEQLLITVRLYTRINLSNASLDELKIPDAVVVELGDKQYQTRINGQAALVVETRYAVFPQKSGTLTIPSLLYQVTAGNGAQDIWNRLYGNSTSNLLRLRTDEREIKVEPAPVDPQAQPWLPAKNIELVEHWSADKDSMKVGEPITRTISIRGQGVTAGQIPPLASFDVKGLSLYQDKAQTDEQKSDKGVDGSRIETTAIVANRPGKFTLPEIKVNWWDTSSNSFKTASIPATSLTVTGVAAADTSSSEEETSSQGDSAVSDQAQIPISPTPVIQVVPSVPWWLYLSQGLTLLILCGLAIAYWNLRRQLHIQKLQQHQVINQQLASEEAAWKQVKRALKNHSPKDLRQALLTWAPLCWRGQKLHSLADISRLCNDPELEAEFKLLDGLIYGNQTQALNTEKLLELLANYRRRSTRASKGDLSPLYPQ